MIYKVSSEEEEEHLKQNLNTTLLWLPFLAVCCICYLFDLTSLTSPAEPQVLCLQLTKVLLLVLP